MATPTLLRLGAWDARNDNFIAHGANPNNAIVDLNDGSTLTLADDDEGKGRGFDWGIPQRDYARSSNLRTRGERLTRQGYYHNRQMAVRLYWGPGATYAAWVAAIQDLMATCEGITNAAPAALQFQAVGSPTLVYADVLSAQVYLPYEELSWLQRQSESVTVVLECAPLWRGAVTTLDNLAWNGGFEGPSGPSVSVFADTFANFNFYSTQAGSTPSVTGFTGFYDAVVSDSPTRYYRLDEATGTVAYDAMASGNNGTYTAGVTLGTTGLCTGDGDKAITLNGTTGDVSLGTTGLPTGNGAWSVACICQIAGAPAGNVSLFSMGSTSGVRTAVWVQITNTRTVQIVTSSTGVVCTSAAISTGAPHLVVATWDGTTARLYIDNAAAVTGTPGALALTYTSGGFLWGANYNTGTPSQFYGGILDEAAIYTGATLAAARVTAYYTAMTTTPTNLPNTMLLPSGSRVAFGSPSWGAINQWILRFEPQAGGTLNAYLHYTDANNYLVVSVANRTTFSMVQNVAGSPTTVATGSVTLSGAWYWLVVTQFPAIAQGSVLLQAQLYSDNAGTRNTLVTTLGPSAAASTTVAVSGKPQLEAVGTAFTLGGAFSGVHTLSLFGPGGWNLSATSGSAYAAAAWEQNTANTYPNGPVTSYGALRLDAPPAGTWDYTWRLYTGGSAPTWNAANTWAIPATTGEVHGGSVFVKSSGLGASATIRVQVTEYNSSGVQQRQNTFGAVLTGNQATWAEIRSTYTMGASTAYIDVALRLADTSAPGASANAIVWVDNLLWWNITTTGVASMPYCETRFPQSPAQIVVSGLQGVTSIPAWVALGTFYSSWVPGTAVSYALGRRAQFSAASRMVDWTGGLSGMSTALSAVLDSTSFCGHYRTGNLTSAGCTHYVASPHPADQRGDYHLLERFYSAASVGNLPKILVRVVVDTQTTAWVALTPFTEILAHFYGLFSATGLLSATTTWTMIDAGRVSIPPFPAGAQVDLSQNYVPTYAQWQDNSGANTTARANWGALLPMDATTLLGVVNQPANNPNTPTNTWVMLYFDGLLAGRNTLYDLSSAGYSLETTPVADPAPSSAGSGTIGSGTINVNQTGNSEITLDPTIGASTGRGGVNQLLGVLTDNNGVVLPLVTQFRYIPNYTYPP